MTIQNSRMQAIRTVYLVPTNSRGSRIKATAAAGSITVPYEYGSECAHTIAAQALLDKLGWKGDMFGGTLPDGSHAFVFINRTGE